MFGLIFDGHVFGLTMDEGRGFNKEEQIKDKDFPAAFLLGLSLFIIQLRYH